jgi:hypothetical protein
MTEFFQLFLLIAGIYGVRNILSSLEKDLTK